MAAPTHCRQCGETLRDTVPFCPFCGTSRDLQPIPVAPRPVAAPAAPPGTLPSLAAEPPWTPPRPRQSIVSPVQRVQQGPTRVARRPTAPRRRAAARQGNAVARLVIAGVLLLVGWLLWRHLIDIQHSSIVVTVGGPATGIVLVDDVAAGSPDQPISVAPGRHRIGFDATGYRTPTLTVDLAEGQTRRLSLSPIASPALLTLDSDPAGAGLAVDGHRLGRGPVSRHLAAGVYRITATLPGFLPTDRTIELTPGSEARLVLTLQPVPLRTLELEVPVGHWSDPIVLAAGDRFTLLFRSAVRVRIDGHVVLLRPGTPMELGAADANGLSFTSVGDIAVPISLLIARTPSAESH